MCWQRPEETAPMVVFTSSSSQSPSQHWQHFGQHSIKVLNLRSLLQENRQKQVLSFIPGRRYEPLLPEQSLHLAVRTRIFKAVEVHCLVPRRQPACVCISKPLERWTKCGWNGRLFVIWGEQHTLYSEWPNWSNYRADSCVIIEISKWTLPPLLEEGYKSG